MHLFLLLSLPTLVVAAKVDECDSSVPLVKVPLEAYQNLFRSAHFNMLDAQKQECYEQSAKDAEELAALRDDLTETKAELQNHRDNVRHEDASRRTRLSQDLIGLFGDGVQLLQHTCTGSFNVSAAREAPEADIATFNISVSLRLLPRSPG